MKNNGITLSSPWITFYRELRALFEKDPDIEIDYDDDQKEINLYVDNEEKAEAISVIVPYSRTFGNVTVFVNVIPANDVDNYVFNHDKITIETFETAFEGNPTFEYVYTSQKLPISYVIFKNKVVQYFNDALNDVHGLCSTLYQEIAKDVFGQYDGIYFCTELGKAEIGMPLGEWP